MSEPETPLQTGTTEIRVRYTECDPMGITHHASYPVWFEIGRTELCRDAGIRYRDLEEAGVFLAVVSLAVKYRAPARYDDVLQLETRLVRVTRVKLEHEYRLTRDGLELATGASALACLDAEGRPQLVPELLRVGAK